SVDLPVTFTTLDGRLSISSDEKEQAVTIFYRPAPPPGGVRTREGTEQLTPIRVMSRPDIAEVIARLGGEGFEHARGLSFNYGQIVSILSNLITKQQLVALAGGMKLPASFILQELPQAA